MINLNSSLIRIQLALKSLTNLVTNIYIQRAFELEEILATIQTNNSIDIVYNRYNSID